MKWLSRIICCLILLLSTNKVYATDEPADITKDSFWEVVEKDGEKYFRYYHSCGEYHSGWLLVGKDKDNNQLEEPIWIYFNEEGFETTLSSDTLHSVNYKLDDNIENNLAKLEEFKEIGLASVTLEISDKINGIEDIIKYIKNNQMNLYLKLEDNLSEEHIQEIYDIIKLHGLEHNIHFGSSDLDILRKLASLDKHIKIEYLSNKENMEQTELDKLNEEFNSTTNILSIILNETQTKFNHINLPIEDNKYLLLKDVDIQLVKADIVEPIEELITITFTDGIMDGKVFEPIILELNKGDDIIVPEIPTEYEDYINTGWNQEVPKTALTNLTIESKWYKVDESLRNTSRLITVTFTDGTENNEFFEDIVITGLQGTSFEIPTVEGNDTTKFNSWTPMIQNFIFESDKTYTATWKKIEPALLQQVAPQQPQKSSTTNEKKYFTVSFTDGNGYTYKTEQVLQGESATPVSYPQSNNKLVFNGWDKDYTNVQENLTVNATWKEKLSVPNTGDYIAEPKYIIMWYLSLLVILISTKMLCKYA